MSVKITDLNNAGTLDGSEIVPIVQAGETVQTTAQDVANLCDLSSICIKAGDVVSSTGIRSLFICGATYSGAAKSLSFAVPFNKIMLATSVSVSGTIYARGINGYLHSSSGIDLSDTSIVSSVSAVVLKTGGVRINIAFVDVPTGGTNNTPVIVENGATFTFTFS